MTAFPEVVMYFIFLHGNSSSSTWYLEHRTFHEQRPLGPRRSSLTPTDQIGLSSTKKWLDAQTVSRVWDDNRLKERPATEMVRTCRVNAGC